MPGVIIKIIIMGGGFSGQICIPLGGKVYQSSVMAPDKVRGSFFPLMQRDKGMFYLSSSKELSHTTLGRWKWLHFHSSSQGSLGWHWQQSFKHLVLACPDSLPWLLPVPPLTQTEMRSLPLDGPHQDSKVPQAGGKPLSCLLVACVPAVISFSDLSSHSPTMPALQCHVETATREQLLKQQIASSVGLRESHLRRGISLFGLAIQWSIRQQFNHYYQCCTVTLWRSTKPEWKGTDIISLTQFNRELLHQR